MPKSSAAQSERERLERLADKAGLAYAAIPLGGGWIGGDSDWAVLGPQRAPRCDAYGDETTRDLIDFRNGHSSTGYTWMPKEVALDLAAALNLGRKARGGEAEWV